MRIDLVELVCDECGKWELAQKDLVDKKLHDLGWITYPPDGPDLCAKCAEGVD